MADLDESIFPYVFECSCGATTEITREDVIDALPTAVEATTRQAVNRALRSKDWWEVEGEMRCPACVDERDT